MKETSRPASRAFARPVDGCGSEVDSGDGEPVLREEDRVVPDTAAEVDRTARSQDAVGDEADEFGRGPPTHGGVPCRYHRSYNCFTSGSFRVRTSRRSSPRPTLSRRRETARSPQGDQRRRVGQAEGGATDSVDAEGRTEDPSVEVTDRLPEGSLAFTQGRIDAQLGAEDLEPWRAAVIEREHLADQAPHPPRAPALGPLAIVGDPDGVGEPSDDDPCELVRRAEVVQDGRR